MYPDALSPTSDGPSRRQLTLEIGLGGRQLQAGCQGRERTGRKPIAPIQTAVLCPTSAVAPKDDDEP